MASKRKVFLHVGLDDGSGDILDAALERHGRPLAELGVRRPATSSEEMFRAALEMLRTHRDWGYRREEVEGVWTSIVRRGLPGKDTLVFSQPLLAGARPEQVALLVDALAGFEVHVVVTAHAPDAWTIPGEPRHDLGVTLATWGAAVKKPERLHVLITPSCEELDAARHRKATWKAFGRVVGFGTSSLKVDDVVVPTKPRPPRASTAARADVLTALGESWVELLSHGEHDVVGDVADLVPPPGTGDDAPGAELARADVAERALADALVEIERLARRNESLRLKVESLEKKRKKLKRRLSAA